MSNSINPNFIKNGIRDLLKISLERGASVRKNTLQKQVNCISGFIFFILGLSLVICGSCGLISFLPSVICGSILIAYTLLFVLARICFLYKKNLKKLFKKSSLPQESVPTGFYADRNLQRAMSATPPIVDPTISEVLPIKLPTDEKFVIPRFSNEIRLDPGKEMNGEEIKNVHDLHIAVRVLLGNDKKSIPNREMMHDSALEDLKVFRFPWCCRTSNLVYESGFFPGIIFKSRPLSQIRRYEKAHKVCKKIILENNLDLICLPKMYVEKSSVLKYDDQDEPWGLILEEKLNFNKEPQVNSLPDSSEKTALYLQMIKFVKLTLFRSQKKLSASVDSDAGGAKIALLEPECIQILSGDHVDKADELRIAATSFLSVAKSLGQNGMLAEMEKIIAACLELCSTREIKEEIKGVRRAAKAFYKNTLRPSANSNTAERNGIQISEKSNFQKPIKTKTPNFRVLHITMIIVGLALGLGLGLIIIGAVGCIPLLPAICVACDLMGLAAISVLILNQYNKHKTRSSEEMGLKDPRSSGIH